MQVQQFKNHKKELLVIFLLVLLWIGLAKVTGSFCFFKSTIGMPCPGCGSTRAAVALLHGEISLALKWHPLIFVSLILLPALLIVSALERFKLVQLKQGVISKIFIVLIILYLVVYIVRMFLYFPDTKPMVFHENALWMQLLSLISS